MTSIVVLLKLVPDIRHIPDDAWDIERGTLRRNRLQLVPNPLDDRALALALRIREQWNAPVLTLSMGPPQAMSLCARSVALGADEAVLVSDPACAGSDTLATSLVLSRAIEKLCSNTRDVLILSGMQSPDGDTAQVPIQVAAMLDAGVIPYVTGATIHEQTLELSGIAAIGDTTMVLGREELPAVVTCTERLPGPDFHTTLAGLSRAASNEVRILTAPELNLSDSETGLAGSATRVVSIAVAQSVRRDVTVIDWGGQTDPARAAADIIERIQFGLDGNVSARSEPDSVPIAQAAPASSANPPTEDGIPKNAVWALVENDPDRLGILAHAREIAGQLGCSTVACLAVPDSLEITEDEKTSFASAGADRLVLMACPDSSDPIPLATALQDTVLEFNAQVLLIPASPDGRVAAPYVAARIGAGLTADCTRFTVKDYSARRAGKRKTWHNVLHQQRPALGGNIEATIVSPTNIERGLPQMATVRPGPTVPVESAAELVVHRWQPDVQTHSGTLRAALRNTGTGTNPSVPGPVASAQVDIERCKVLVAVGKGIGGQTGIGSVAEPLAEALRRRYGVEVEIAASRMVVDAGDLSRDRQVGQTGKVVKPDVYIALGISGSAQHRAGMEGSGFIVSVNTDPNAPIRHFSDVFVHGQVQDVVPAISELLARH